MFIKDAYRYLIEQLPSPQAEDFSHFLDLVETFSPRAVISVIENEDEPKGLHYTTFNAKTVEGKSITFILTRGENICITKFENSDH